MGIYQCCFARNKDEEKSARTKMVLEYLNAMKKLKKEEDAGGEFFDGAISDTANLSVVSLDEALDKASI